VDKGGHPKPRFRTDTHDSETVPETCAPLCVGSMDSSCAAAWTLLLLLRDQDIACGPTDLQDGSYKLSPSRRTL
jgi:hypothetical protein